VSTHITPTIGERRRDRQGVVWTASQVYDDGWLAISDTRHTIRIDFESWQRMSALEERTTSGVEALWRFTDDELKAIALCRYPTLVTDMAVHRAWSRLLAGAMWELEKRGIRG
jgi:hypothetical protein